MKSARSLARSVSFPRVINISDLGRLARRRFRGVVFAYIDGGADDEPTLRENRRVFPDIPFRPRQCVAVPSCELRTTVLGTTLDVPFILAPVGFCRMFYPRGEVHAARAANDAGTGYILSTFSAPPLRKFGPAPAGLSGINSSFPAGRTSPQQRMPAPRAPGTLRSSS